VPAGVLLLFANGTSAIPAAAWLAPVLLLRFVRTRRAAVGLPVAYALLAATAAFGWRGMIPGGGAWCYAVAALTAVPALLPYAVDRWLAPRLGGLAGTLVFPAAWAGTEFLVSLSPGGTWGSVAYTQDGQMPLLQVLSVTGLWGVTFLIGWSASVANLLWAEGRTSPAARRAALALGATLAAVLLLGGARLALWPPSARAVRVASLSRERVDVPYDPEAWRRLLQGRASPGDVEGIRRWADAVHRDLLARSAREARAGAKIIFWGEGNALVLAEDEPALIHRGRELARTHQVYLGMALSAWDFSRRDRPRQNKLVLITPSGEVAWEYLKAHPVPSGESLTVAGDGQLRSLDTPYGRLSAAICFDADFPRLLAQAGALGADVLLDPADDWRAIDPLHTRMAGFRAIEQGVNLVRHASNGLSAAYDYQGRVLAAMDHYQATDHVLVAQVPVKGVRTLYGWAGDCFAWLCLAMLAALATRALRRPARASASAHTGLPLPS
jgi:apolipoprotein N-acyltransferase